MKTTRSLLPQLCLGIAINFLAVAMLRASDQEALELLEETIEVVDTGDTSPEPLIDESYDDALEPAEPLTPELIANDTAADPVYNDGWTEETNGGFGFGPWQLITHTGPNESHAGFEIEHSQVAQSSSENGTLSLENLAPGRTWTLFALGVGYEQALALRPFNTPLQPGDSFSFRLRQTQFLLAQRVDDATPGEVGVALQSGGAVESLAVDEWDAQALWKFAVREGQQDYEIFAADGWRSTGIPLSTSDVLVTFSLNSPSTASVTIRLLSREMPVVDSSTENPDAYTTEEPSPPPAEVVLKDVALAHQNSSADSAKITHVLLFNRDGERGDSFFTDLRVERAQLSQ